MAIESNETLAGEIIPIDAPGGSVATSVGTDVIDADFETLRIDPSERLLDNAQRSAIPSRAAPRQGLESLRRGGFVRRAGQAARGGPVFWTVGLGLVFGAFWVSGGHSLVRQAGLIAPAQRIDPANPLRIADVSSRVEERGGRKVLFVEGKAINGGERERILPPIEISVVAGDGSAVSYKLGTSHDPVLAGGAISFSSRFEAPKDGVKSVFVTFRG